MATETVYEILLAASAIVAGLAAMGIRYAKRFFSVATALSIAATAFLVKATDFFN